MHLRHFGASAFVFLLKIYSESGFIVGKSLMRVT